MRPAFRSKSRQGRYDVLPAYRVERFPADYPTFWTYSANSTKPASRSPAAEPFDTSASIGRMLMKPLSVFAEFEREAIIDRVISGMPRARHRTDHLEAQTDGVRGLGKLRYVVAELCLAAPVPPPRRALERHLDIPDGLVTFACALTAGA